MICMYAPILIIPCPNTACCSLGVREQLNNYGVQLVVGMDCAHARSGEVRLGVLIISSDSVEMVQTITEFWD